MAYHLYLTGKTVSLMIVIGGIPYGLRQRFHQGRAGRRRAGHSPPALGRGGAVRVLRRPALPARDARAADVGALPGLRVGRDARHPRPGGHLTWRTWPDSNTTS